MGSRIWNDMIGFKATDLVQNKREPPTLQSNSRLSSSDHAALSSVHLMLSAADVRRELVAVLAAVATDVALEGLAETVATHVDGKHDVVQEEDATVPAVEGAHRPTIPV
ncbi:hypothetical protein EYF80_007305 [Liparis tanakae]|uniref:Uncharacterized protein n=1 Tax=Liparis tanakae TaxID=230148 RepID=A0A4Z2IWX5_9TELE|nr:hypothetical protein EYF80_007305 [Liparis tanakae]